MFILDKLGRNVMRNGVNEKEFLNPLTPDYSGNIMTLLCLNFAKYLENHSKTSKLFLYKAYNAYTLTCIDNEQQNSKL